MAAAIVSRTPCRFVMTSWLLKRRTCKPLPARKASRRASRRSCFESKCWPPSISTTRLAAGQRKSTMYGPIGVWRRKLAPFRRWPRRAAQISLSASVECVRSDRARTRCFVEIRQFGTFGGSAIVGVACLPPPQPSPASGGGSAPRPRQRFSSPGDPIVRYGFGGQFLERAVASSTLSSSPALR
jgi:hypothetical protein